MIKELEKVMIEDVEYSFDPEKEYIKDGHAYCKVCHERKDGKALEFFGKQMIFKTACKCDRDREAKEKERQKQLEIERLKSICFTSMIQWAYTFENYHGKENALIRFARRPWRKDGRVRRLPDARAVPVGHSGRAHGRSREGRPF